MAYHALVHLSINCAVCGYGWACNTYMAQLCYNLVKNYIQIDPLQTLIKFENEFCTVTIVILFKLT